MPRPSEIPRLDTTDPALSRAWDVLRGILNPWLRAALPTVITVRENYQATPENGTIAVNAVSAALSVTLPSAASMKDRTLNVKKVDASANAVTVRALTGETIDGAATASTIVQWFSFGLVSDGARWYVT